MLLLRSEEPGPDWRKSTTPRPAEWIKTHRRAVPSSAQVVRTLELTLPSSVQVVWTSELTVPSSVQVVRMSELTLPSSVQVVRISELTLPGSAQVVRTSELTLPNRQVAGGIQEAPFLNPEAGLAVFGWVFSDRRLVTPMLLVPKLCLGTPLRGETPVSPGWHRLVAASGCGLPAKTHVGVVFPSEMSES